ncbi:protein phosphatase 2C domain-containing protein [Paraliobacillus salinarum]|uniref:protein phosphatase 2C domain-containing protein n=1 Tax=Paraliobacillus salinarum TaxID=1158996 RepID=UPI0015F4F5C2|nr:protein phosphatase 2C domain-containing protein [Paraliobacillus salinarum]
MKVTKVYKNGSRPINEDRFVINEQANIYAVIDGATGLDGGLPGKLASETFQTHLADAASQDTLLPQMKQANDQLNNLVVSYYKQNFENSTDVTAAESIPKQKRSTTGIAAIQLNKTNTSFEYVHAGDCMLFLKFDDGKIRTVTYDMVHHFDQLAINQIRTLREQYGETAALSDLRKQVNPILLANREKYNTPEGYRILDGTKEGYEQLEYGQVHLNKVSQILLLSDGLLLPSKDQENNGWEATAMLAFSSGLDALLTEVQKREVEDEACIIYPRLKQHDDKTGILIEMK